MPILHPGNQSLTDFIRERIRKAGPVPFAWFMEQALYHPAHGYYSSGKAALGRGGDYFTNVSVGPLFGRLMAMQFAEMWTQLGDPSTFVVVEQGAHDGQFAHDVLTSAAKSSPQFYEALRYRIVEPFPILRNRQAETLAAFADRVAWSESLEFLAPFTGVHFSNELLDALPVHVVRWDGAEWLERHVTATPGGFEFFDLPARGEALRERLNGLPKPAGVGYETEVNVAVLDWVDGVAQKLESGFLLAVDYGLARDDFYAPHRMTGTLQCRARHRIVPSPIEQVGAADITAHVEWTSIAERAESRGLSLLGYTDQHHFITGLLAESGPDLIDDSADAKTKRALQTLLHPGFLGMKFQYLILGKGVPRGASIAGVRFARDAREALGLAPR